MSSNKDDSIYRLLENNWRSIASEVPSTYSVFDVSRIKSRGEVFLEMRQPKWVSGWDGYARWLNYPLVFNGIVFEHDMPKTEEVLQCIPQLNFAAFLILKSGMAMKRHSHPENSGLVTYHLGLDVPDECYLNADGEFIKHETGKAFSFDGTKPHYAFNASSLDRLILHCEVSSKI